MKLTRHRRMMYIAISVIIPVIVSAAYYLYTSSLPKRLQAAEGKAHEFCAATAIGSDISGAVARAKADHVFWGSEKGYTFYFPATMFDKAVCEVNVDREGRVVSKGAEMEYD
jgi:hypothetical protein